MPHSTSNLSHQSPQHQSFSSSSNHRTPSRSKSNSPLPSPTHSTSSHSKNSDHYPHAFEAGIIASSTNRPRLSPSNLHHLSSRTSYIASTGNGESYFPTATSSSKTELESGNSTRGGFFGASSGGHSTSHKNGHGVGSEKTGSIPSESKGGSANGASPIRGPGITSLNLHQLTRKSTTPPSSAFVFNGPPPSMGPSNSGTKSTTPPIPAFHSLQFPSTFTGVCARPPRAPIASTSTSTSTRYTPFTPDSLATLLSSPSSANSVLILDIRPHTHFLTLRLSNSLNICIPTTLLRRATYGITQLSLSMSPSERIVFDSYRSNSAIIVLDGDSFALKEGGGVGSLLGKFDRAGFEGTLGWLKGGWNTLTKERKSGEHSAQWEALLDAGELSTKESEVIGEDSMRQDNPILQVRDLPISAFQQASTSAFAHAGLPSSSLTTPLGSRPSTPSVKAIERPGLLGKRRKSGMTNAAGGGFGLKLGLALGDNNVKEVDRAGKEKRMATNPFFDNIRQNSEALSLSRSLENLFPISLPPLPHVSQQKLTALIPPFLLALIDLPPIARAEHLARQFYELEVAERERLEGTLNWHATVQGKENGEGEADGYRKFGISAGVELGGLNRFKNIFPYDHARVRLESYPTGATDYINASHLQLSSSPKRFIASQGPLLTTFPDFWQMCHQENVGVIIMLTNLHEGGREKCGAYWRTERSCKWEVEVEGGDGAEEGCGEVGSGGSFFSGATNPVENKADPMDSTSDHPEVKKDTTIRRTLHIRRRDHSTPARKIRHIQYRAWPDFDIPAQPSDLVALVREVEQAQSDYKSEIGWKEGMEEPSIVTHCSAGVGRTGVFIAVMSLLDKMRRDRKEVKDKKEREKVWSRERSREEDKDEMDLEMAVASNLMDVDTTTTHSTDSILTSSSDESSADSDRASFASSQTSTAVPPSPSSSITSDSTANLVAGLSASTLNPYDPTSPSLTSTSPALKNAQYPAVGGDEIEPPLSRHDPIFASVNEMREQRMSMVANYRQYVCVHECTLVGLLEDLEAEGSL